MEAGCGSTSRSSKTRRAKNTGGAMAQELNDLRLVFANVSGCKQFMGLRSILKLPEVSAQIAQGDLRAEDLENAWLEACAVKGIASVDPLDVDGAKYHVHYRGSWGVCTELSFEGFLHFLRLCEERVATPPTDDATETEAASPMDSKTGRDLVTARHRMVGLLRATLTVHERGGSEEGDKIRLKDMNAQLGETLHLSMVRAAMEESMANHTRENLQGLARSGVYQELDFGAQPGWREKKALLQLGLQTRKFSHCDLVRSGILLEKTPVELAHDRADARRVLRRHYVKQHHSIGSPADLLPLGSGGEGILTSGRSRQHHRRLSLDDLKARGIFRNPEEQLADERRHRLAAAFLQKELRQRSDISHLQEKGIYLSPVEETRRRLEKSMLADLLNKSFRERPYREDLMDRGVLESEGLRSAFLDTEAAKGGPIRTVEDVLKCPVVECAVKEGVVRMPALKEAFVAAMKLPDGGGNREQMGYEQFDNFLSCVRTTQVEEEPYSLKLWAVMQVRPELEDQEHHQGNRRRNALMAKELETELNKRAPLEHLANKGIYVDKTPAEGAVERAHLVHTLAHGLAHRPELAELSHKGVYLEGVDPNDLEKCHRDARNYLEGTLSLRPELSTLQDKGYLEADELEEAFTELIVEYKHKNGAIAPSDSLSSSSITAPRAAAATAAESNAGGGSGSCRSDPKLLLPADRLVSWAPVQKMLRSGAAMDDDVALAVAKAQEASFHRKHHPHHHHEGKEAQHSNDDDAHMVDFVGFLEFIHSLDVEVDGLDASAGGKKDDHDDNDPEAAAKHARRLRMRRERAAHAAERDGYGTLKEHLLAHLRTRPARRDPETQRIAKGFHSTQAVDLEKSLLRDQLERHFRTRAASAATSLESYSGGGDGGGGASRGPSGRDGERAARIKELALAINQRMLRYSLVGGGGAGTGVSQAAAAAAAGGVDNGVDLAAVIEVIQHRLSRRVDLDDLKKQGIFQRITPLQRSLDRHLIERRLSTYLGNPLRPSKKDLIDHGIYIDNPRELQMEHYLAARNVKHGLEGRETVQDLKNRGIYIPESSERAAHEKRLVKALLQRKLSRAFSKEELGRLKQKGIYKEAEHEKLDAERLLITRQLARLVSQRPNPDQLEREHPGIMEAGALALVFEERVMPHAAGAPGAAGAGAVVAGNGGWGGEGGGAGEREVAAAKVEGSPEHLVSFQGLMTWPDVQEHLAGDGGEDKRHEMARHFALCDSDGDGYLSFSQFLRWVELCDLNPEDHLQVTDSDLDAEYVRLKGVTGKGVSLDQAVSNSLVKRWAASGSLDRQALSTIWGVDSKGEGSQGVMKDAAGFKIFCRDCEARSSACHKERLKDLKAKASSDEAKAKASLRAKIAAKLKARPDLEDLKKSRVYRAGGLDPAVVHLERNLIAVSLKEQLLARPAVEDLEKRGIKPVEGNEARLERNRAKLREALDSTMKHDDARWRSRPSELLAGSREEVSASLKKNLSKRPSVDQLINKGIYVVDTDASYALLLHQVLRTHRSFKMSSAQLVAGL